MGSVYMCRKVQSMHPTTAIIMRMQGLCAQVSRTARTCVGNCEGKAKVCSSYTTYIIVTLAMIYTVCPHVVQ